MVLKELQVNTNRAVRYKGALLVDVVVFVVDATACAAETCRSLIELQVRARMPLDDRPCVYARAHMGCAIASQRSQKANIFCISHAGC